MKVEIGVLGAGRFAKEVALYAARLGIEVVHFFDGTVPGAKLEKRLPYCIGVGSPETKRLVLEQSGCELFFSVFDPDCLYDRSDVVGRGCVIAPGVVLTTNVVLGDFVTLNQNCTVGHDCRLGRFVNVAPGANVSGNVVMGEGCDVGTNAAIREKLTLCANVRLGLNCGVVADIFEPGTYVGTPARMLDR